MAISDPIERERLRKEIERLGKQAKAIRAWAHKSESAPRIKAMLEMAKPMLAIDISELDRDPMLFNIKSGTIELKTGTHREHRREDFITKLVAEVRYDKNAKCPRWTQFLGEVFRQHADVIPWLKRAVGYSMTGLIREHVFFQLYGTGRNGKSTLMTVLKWLLGDYAITVPFAIFTESRQQQYRDGEAPRPFLVRFKGTRLVAAQEPKEGAIFSEDLIKTLTGGDLISARSLHEKPIEFSPTHKVWLSGNHKPVIKGADVGIWSRPRLIPFDECFEGKEEQGLDDTLKAELPGILNWALEGCLEWQKDGLGTCTSVKNATQQYQKEQDLLQPWLDNCCVILDGNMLRSRKGYESFGEFHGGKAPFSEVVFAERMAAKGFERASDKRGNYYKNIGLLDTWSAYSSED